ncbi:peroxiredoxin [Aquimarina sp. ERC-38]|uniref:peroxiredoxin n=1 Tax=Aquimarina sp. ERC-38 TaxID=2949996 RepID=UPI002245FA7F|nr:peroxiredoxin [Aquimarina sp. ERC-38]UZO79412.1 peroxiredoxin [Aquimarina sp. ERC-38]
MANTRIQVGDKAPSFKGVVEEDVIFDTSDLIGKKPFVLYFYPKDFTPGCTKEACQFRDSYEDFTEAGAEVIGVSSDSVKSHEKFKEKHRLPFILLSDLDGAIRKAYGVKSSLFGLLPGRETFVIDQNGIIQMQFNNLNASDHMKKALKIVKKLKD